MISFVAFMFLTQWSRDAHRGRGMMVMYRFVMGVWSLDLYGTITTITNRLQGKVIDMAIVTQVSYSNTSQTPRFR